jgi:hypothetical protein
MVVSSNYPKFSMGDRVINTEWTDYNPPYDKLTSYGIVNGYYYQDCASEFESPLGYKGWVYIVKVYNISGDRSKQYLTMFTECEITLQTQLKRVK